MRKTLFVLSLVMIAVSADYGSLRKLAEEDEKLVDNKDVIITHTRDNNGNDEMDVDIKIKSCKKDSEECESLYDDDDDVEDVSLSMFSSLIAEDMLKAVDKDQDENGDGEGRLLQGQERKLHSKSSKGCGHHGHRCCRHYPRCYYYRYCNCCRCYYARRCSYYWHCH